MYPATIDVDVHTPVRVPALNCWGPLAVDFLNHEMLLCWTFWRNVSLLDIIHQMRHICFCCVQNKSPKKKRKKEDGCLTEIYLTILEARSKNPMESGSPCSLNDTVGTSMLCPPWASVSGHGWCSRLVPALVRSLPPSSHGILPVWVCTSHAILPPSTVSSKITSLIALEPVQRHWELIHLNLVTLTKALSPNKIISLGKISTYPFEGFQVNPQHKAIINTVLKRL